MSREQITTIHELIDLQYGGGLNPLTKADSPTTTSTTGVFNRIYGAYAFNQLNMEGNAIALLPKYPWPSSGFRAITALPSGNNYGGVGEGGTIPDSIDFTYAEIDVDPKEIMHSFEVSFRHQTLSKTDDAIADLEMKRGLFATYHAERMSSQCMIDGDTLAGDNLESIDRITASNAYATAVSWTAGDEDIYGIDRSSNSWADAQVSHNSGVDRFLTDEIIRDLLASLKTAGARTNIMLTGSDTASKIYGLYNNQVRYPGVLEQNTMAQIGLNGVETEEGIGAGIKVASVYMIPLFETQHAEQDTISRIYLLDTTMQEGTGIPRLGFCLATPTMYFETGMSADNPNPFVLNKTTTKGMYYTMGEIVCTFLAAQGSIRDLK
jgi:hypothetical protein